MNEHGTTRLCIVCGKADCKFFLENPALLSADTVTRYYQSGTGKVLAQTFSRFNRDGYLSGVRRIMDKMIYDLRKKNR